MKNYLVIFRYDEDHASSLNLKEDALRKLKEHIGNREWRMLFIDGTPEMVINLNNVRVIEIREEK